MGSAGRLLATLALAGCAAAPLQSEHPPAADLLFSSTRDGASGIYLLKAGQRESQLLEANGNWPVWSPEGQRVLFQSRRSGNLDLWVLDLAGGAARQLTQDPEPDYLPAWSPDGREIVFTSWRKEAGENERAPHLYLMNPDGSAQRRLPLASLKTSAGANWSADARWLVYSRQVNGKGADLFIAARDGSQERQLTHDSAANIHNGSPSFSPDGQWIAFYADADKGTAELQLIRPDGSGRRTLRATGKNWYPRWSADGRWLLVTAPAEPAADGSSDAGNVDLFALPLLGEPRLTLLIGGPKREQEGSWRPPR